MEQYSTLTANGTVMPCLALTYDGEGQEIMKLCGTCDTMT